MPDRFNDSIGLTLLRTEEDIQFTTAIKSIYLSNSSLPNEGGIQVTVSKWCFINVCILFYFISIWY